MAENNFALIDLKKKKILKVITVVIFTPCIKINLYNTLMTVQFFQGMDYSVNTKGLINREDESEIFTTEEI